jgi:hypothetical protein
LSEPSDPADRFTLLTTLNKEWATKGFYLDPQTGEIAVIGYGSATYFRFREGRFTDIYRMAYILARLERAKTSFIVRGEPVPGTNLQRATRRSRPGAATLRPVARDWGCVDLDKIPCPPGLDPDDRERARDYLIASYLPPEFHDVTLWFQWSSSQGVPLKGKSRELLSAHVWVKFDRPIPDVELQRWARAQNAGGPVYIDFRTFVTVQPNYTASPLFGKGLDDPLPPPLRSGLVQGSKDVVALVLPAREEARARTKRPRSSAKEKPATDEAGQEDAGQEAEAEQEDAEQEQRAYTGGGFEGYLALLGDGPGLAGFQEPILKAIASYVWEHGADGTDREALKARLREAIAAAPRGPGRSEGDIKRYLSDRFLDDKIDWTLARESEARAAAGAGPTFPDTGVSLEEGERRSREAVARFMARVKWQDEEPETEGFAGVTDADIDDLFAPTALALVQTLGSGKTLTAIEAIALAPAGARVNFLAPDHALGAELLARITQAAGDRHRVTQVFGRGMKHPSGEPMCQEHKLAAAVSRLGYSVQSTLCKSKTAVCPHFDGCLYQRQRADRNKPGIYIGPHAYLGMTEERSPLGRAHLTIIDEDPTGALIRDWSLPLDAISADDLRGLSEADHANAERWSRLARELLLGAGTNELMAQQCRTMEIHWYDQIKKLPITPDMPRAAKEALLEAAAAAAAATLAGRVARFWGLLGEVIGGSELLRPFRVYEAMTRAGLKEKRVAMSWSLDPKIKGPVILLDGTANDEILRRFWSDIAIERIDIKAEHYHAIQITDRAVSKTMLAYDGEKPEEQNRSRNNRAKLAQIGEVVGALVDGRVPVFTYKNAAKALREEHPELVDAGVEVGFERHDGEWAGHLGNVRGLDRWRDAPAAIIAGRLVPGHEGLGSRLN